MEPASEIDAFYICHKQPYATYMVLKKFRMFYPNSKIFLFSNNGYDYTEMAKEFNCEYNHLKKEIAGVSHAYNMLSEKEMIDLFYYFLDICRYVYQKSSARFIIKLEDDLDIRGSIDVSNLKGAINGPTLHKLPMDIFNQFNNYYPEYKLSPIINDVFFSGHGGCIFDRKKIVDCLMKKNIIEKIIDLYINLRILNGYLIDDVFFSILVIVCGYTIYTTEHQLELKYFFSQKDDPKYVVLHDYKEYYDQPMPKELEYLVKH